MDQVEYSCYHSTLQYQIYCSTNTIEIVDIADIVFISTLT